MKEYYVIDAYNVIHAWSKLKCELEENLEEARVKFIEMMREYQSFKGIKIIIVFDAHLSKKSIGVEENVKGIEIIYTKYRETADSYIEKRIVSLLKKAKITVVTSDWAEQQVVFGEGALRMSARELIIDYDHIKNKIRSNPANQINHRESVENRLTDEVIEKFKKMVRGK
ncbi:MAG: NYN domain-containing protein [Clostridiales bacterium]|nr:NYN domain-containing protein [Clostridiales bacterium]